MFFVFVGGLPKKAFVDFCDQAVRAINGLVPTPPLGPACDSTIYGFEDGSVFFRHQNGERICWQAGYEMEGMVSLA